MNQKTIRLMILSSIAGMSCACSNTSFSGEEKAPPSSRDEMEDQNNSESQSYSDQQGCAKEPAYFPNISSDSQKYQAKKTKLNAELPMKRKSAAARVVEGR